VVARSGRRKEEETKEETKEEEAGGGSEGGESRKRGTRVGGRTRQKVEAENTGKTETGSKEMEAA